MITNERQYRITRSAAERFEDLLAQIPEAEEGIPAPLQRARREAAESQLHELREQIGAYETLRRSAGAVLEFNALDQLPEALIAARISSGLTQRQLADRLGVKEQQVQRDERTRYAHATFDRMVAVARALQTPIQLRALLPATTVTGSSAQETESVGP